MDSGYIWWLRCLMLMLFASVSTPLTAQPAFQLFKVYTQDSVNIDSIRISVMKGGEDLTHVISTPLNDSCNSIQLDFWYKGCGGPLTQFLDTTLPMNLQTNRIIAYSILDTSVNCGYPDTPTVGSVPAEWSSCASISITEHRVNENSVQVYPNPAYQRIYINSEELPETIRVYDITGQLLTTKFNTREIYLEEVLSGKMIWLEIWIDKQAFRRRILIQ